MWRTYATAIPDQAVAPKLAASIRSSLGLSSAERLGVECAASLLRCSLVPFSPSQMQARHHSASLMPRSRGDLIFEIRHNEDELRRSRRRWRFSIAHEFGHTFFFERFGERAVRLPRWSSSGEESFCNAFAGDLLCPAGALGTAIGPVECWRISDELLVSPQVVALQALRHAAFEWRALLGLAMRGKPTDPSHEAFRVVWAVTPKGTYIPIWDKYDKGPAREALEKGTPVARTAPIDSGSLRGSFEQIAVPGRGNTVVLGVR